MTAGPGPILITGAAGAIGTRLAADLADQDIPLRLLDLHPSAEPPAAAEIVQADLRDMHAADHAAAGTSAIIHLAAVTDEAPFPVMTEHNITGAHHILEAARRHRIPRVVLASSHHVTGFHPTGAPLPADAPLAPDSFYAVSKITTEALGSLYAHKCGIGIVAVRIGSFHPHPSEPRHRATWLSPRDAVALLYAAATRPLPRPFLTVYATSDNPEHWWPRTEWADLDYHPRDSAADHPDPGPSSDQWHGGTYADHPLPPLAQGDRPIETAPDRRDWDRNFNGVTPGM